MVLLRRLSFALPTAIALASLACGGETPAPPPATAPATGATDTGGGHAHEPPHGGVLVELGEEFGHVELALDGAAGTVTAYVLDGEAEQAVRLAQATIGLMVTEPASLSVRPFELVARANALTGETLGDTSQFVLTHDAFKGLASFRGTLVHVVYKGQDFRDIPLTYPIK